MARRAKQVVAPAPTPAEVPSGDRAVLTDAYKAGLIVSWKLDTDRGYCLTRRGRPDEYIEVGSLTSYLAKLKVIA
jgi:hypothetical protein